MSSPHPVPPSASHPFTHEAVLDAETHMYLDGLLGNDLCSSIRFRGFREFGLLELCAVRDS